MTEKVEKRGRPKKVSNTNTIHVNDLQCESISTKKDKFDNTNRYFKITDPNYKHKMNAILSQQCDECKMPFFKIDDNMYMLKVKEKYAPYEELSYINFLNIVFQYYCMETDDGKLLQGYYVQKIEPNEEKENKN